MTRHIFPKRRQRIPANFIPLCTGLLILAIFFSSVGLAAAYNTTASPSESGETGAPQESDLEQDASIQSLTLTADGSSVALTPAFDPDTTRYYATVNASSVSVAASATRSTAGFTVVVMGDSTVTLTPVTNTLTVDVPLTEGQITHFSFTVQAPDGATTRTYHIALGRPASDSTPDITIVADRSEYVPRQGDLAFTVKRTGDTSDNLDVSFNISQDQIWLSPSSFTTTIHAGGTQTTFTIGGTQFLPDVPAHGYLAATVAPIDGYDTSGAPAFVRIVSQETVPTITIEANRSDYVAGLGNLEFTLTREGDPADSLDVTVNFTQSQEWLSDTARTVTFAANDAETSFFIPAGHFSSDVTQSGDLTATVASVADYDVSGATVQVRVISQPGPAVVVAFEHLAYTVAEDAGTLDLVLVARAHTSVPRVGAFGVSVWSDAQTASSDPNAGDYWTLSLEAQFDASDFQMEDGALVGRKTISVTIVDDDVHEGNEYFHLHLGRASGETSEVVLLDPQGAQCLAECPNPYMVTIIDNEGPPVTVQFGLSAYTVAEGSSQDVIVTLSEDPRRTVVIPITITDQDGATGADYSGVPPSVTFNAGEMTKTISFTATPDMDDDDGESVKLSFGSMLPAGVTEGAIKETVVSVTHIELPALTKQPGLSVPLCESNGIFIFWHAGSEFNGDPPPSGWRVERRHSSNGAWVTTRFDFLGAESHALQTHNHKYWDWTDTTRRLGVDYTYRVHALDNDDELMEGRHWSRRAQVLC